MQRPSVLRSLAEAERLRKSGQAALALAIVETHHRLDPQAVAPRHRRAALLQDLGAWPAARVAYERLVADHPEDIRALRLLSILCRRMGDGRAAVRWARAAARLNPDDPHVGMNLVEQLRQSGKIKGALAELRGIMRASGTREPSHRLKRGELLRLQGRWPEAESCLRGVLRDHPDLPAAWVEMSTVLRLMGQPDRAAQAIETALTQAEDTADLRIEAARLSRLAGDLPAALDHLDKGLDQTPGHVGLIVARATVLQKLGRAPDALQMLNDALSDQPRNLQLKVAKAEALRHLHRPDEAEALERGVSVVAPNLPRLANLQLEQALAQNDTATLDRLAQAAEHLADHDVAALRRLATCQIRLPEAEDAPTHRRLALLAQRADRLAPITCWQLAELATYRGQDAAARSLLAAVLDKPTMSGSAATSLTMAMQAEAPEHWTDFADALETRLHPEARADFTLARTTLEHGAAAALARRHRPARGRTPGQIQTLARLVSQVGKPRVAARYLRVARRAYPEELNLWSRHLVHLIESGQSQPALAEIAKVEASTKANDDALRGAAVHALIAMGEAARAEALLDRIADPHQSTRLSLARLRLHLRFRRFDKAEAAMAEYRKTVPVRRAAHMTPTLIGAELLEGHLAEIDLGTEGAADSAQFLAPALAAIDQHPPRRTGQGVIPDRVMQYWNTGTPPTSVEPIMQSWRAAAGLDYQFFDKPAALRFLVDRFDLNWATAMNMARHPAEESDFFRLCWLAAEGGIYADCDDRLLGDWRALTGPRGLMVFREGFGAIGNNLLVAPRAHPAIVEAAVAARRALMDRDNDSIWAKTGPGLVTRAVGTWLARCAETGEDPDMTLMPRHQIGGTVQMHVPAPYKRTGAYWNNQTSGTLGHLVTGLLAAKAPAGDAAAQHDLQNSTSGSAS